MRFNPFAGEDELRLLQGSVGVLPQDSSEASVPEMNPVVKKHLLENVLKRAPATDPTASQMNVNDLGAAPTSPETSFLDEMKDAQDRASDRQGNLGWLQAIAGVGDAIAGRSASTSAAAFDKMRDRIQDQEVGGLEQRRKASEIVKGDEKQKREMDPTSQESSLAQSLAAKMVPSKDFSKMSAQQINGLLPGMSKIYDIEQRKLDRQEARDERRFQSGIKMAEKAEVRNEKKKTAMTEVEDRRRNIEDNLTLLEKMIQDNGTYEMFGSHNADMDRRVEMIATDMAKLADPSSVARPSEVEAFKKGLISSSATNMRNSTALDILKNFRGEIGKRAENAYKVRGLENPGTASQRGESGGEAPQTKVINGKTYKKVSGGWEEQ